jgi:hypothetical protein
MAIPTSRFPTCTEWDIIASGFMHHRCVGKKKAKKEFKTELLAEKKEMRQAVGASAQVEVQKRTRQRAARHV